MIVYGAGVGGDEFQKGDSVEMACARLPSCVYDAATKTASVQYREGDPSKDTRAAAPR
jgi:hypothetical protein